MLPLGSPAIYPCFYGIDIQTVRELIAANHTVEETRRELTARTLPLLKVWLIRLGLMRQMVVSVSLTLTVTNWPLYDYEEDHRSLEEKMLLQVSYWDFHKRKGIRMTKMRVDKPKRVMKLLNESKHAARNTGAQVSWELCGFAACLTFKNRCQRTRSWFQGLTVSEQSSYGYQIRQARYHWSRLCGHV